MRKGWFISEDVRCGSWVICHLNDLNLSQRKFNSLLHNADNGAVFKRFEPLCQLNCDDLTLEIVTSGFILPTFYGKANNRGGTVQEQHKEQTNGFCCAVPVGLCWVCVSSGRF